MNRRAFFALPLVWVYDAPNPNVTCAEPFSRMADQPEDDLFLRDLLLWQHQHPHIRTAYVLLNIRQEQHAGEVLLGKTRFICAVSPSVPTDALYGIMADCGQIL